MDRREAEKNTLGAILRRYQTEVTPSKKSADIESVKIDVIMKDATLPKLKMSAVTSSAVASWRDRRLKQVSGATVNGPAPSFQPPHWHCARALPEPLSELKP